jgi:hypothetical protein
VTDNGRWLVLDARVESVRRTVGPVAWFVVESLVLMGTPIDDGSIEVRTTLRQLAASLELGRDSVAAAVTRLRDEGVLVVSQARDGEGRLRSSRWSLRVPGLTVVAAPPCPAEPDTATPILADPSVRRPRRPSRSASTSPTPHGDTQQLSLLDQPSPVSERLTSPDPKTDRRLQTLTFVAAES